jgi:hypothetical protein
MRCQSAGHSTSSTRTTGRQLPDIGGATHLHQSQTFRYGAVRRSLDGPLTTHYPVVLPPAAHSSGRSPVEGQSAQTAGRRTGHAESNCQRMGLTECLAVPHFGPRPQSAAVVVDTPLGQRNTESYSAEGGFRALGFEGQLRRDLLVRAHVSMQLVLRSWSDIRLLPRDSCLQHS